MSVGREQRDTVSEAEVSQVVSDLNLTHRIIRSEALASRDLRPQIRSSSGVVNLVKARPLNSRLLAGLWEEIQGDRRSLVSYSEMR
jgi:hypothetical protein